MKSGKTGYSVADIEFYAENFISETGDTTWYGKHRKTLNAAINDGKRYFAKHPDEYVNFYASATLIDYYDDGTPASKPDTDCARLGTLDETGEYFDLCESVNWL